MPAGYAVNGGGAELITNDVEAVSGANWKTGVGAFGGKNGGAYEGWATTLNMLKGAARDRVETFFFRRYFTLTAEEAAKFTAAEYEAVYDDAIIIRLNGKKMAARNTKNDNDEMGGYAANMELNGKKPVDEKRRAAWSRYPLILSEREQIRFPLSCAKRITRVRIYTCIF